MIAVINLDAIAGPEPPRLELDADTARSPTPGLVETVRAQLAAETGVRSAAPEHAPAARRPRLPVQPLRAGAVRDSRHPGGHDHDGGRPAAQWRAGRRRTPPRDPPRADRAGDPERDRRAAAGGRARARAVELHLSRQPHRPRLGGRARARRGLAAVSRGDGRPLRALPPAADPRRAGAPQLPQPPRLLGLVRRALRALHAPRGLAGRRRRGRRRSTA